jgi:hypothetical protein
VNYNETQKQMRQVLSWVLLNANHISIEQHLNEEQPMQWDTCRCLSTSQLEVEGIACSLEERCQAMEGEEYRNYK